MIHVSALGRLGGLLDEQLELDPSLFADAAARPSEPVSNSDSSTETAKPIGFTPSSKVLDDMTLGVSDGSSKTVVANQATKSTVEQIFDGAGGLVDVFGRVINGSKNTPVIAPPAPTGMSTGAKVAFVGIGVAAVLGVAYVTLSD